MLRVAKDITQGDRLLLRVDGHKAIYDVDLVVVDDPQDSDGLIDLDLTRKIMGDGFVTAHETHLQVHHDYRFQVAG